MDKKQAEEIVNRVNAKSGRGAITLDVQAYCEAEGYLQGRQDALGEAEPLVHQIEREIEMKDHGNSCRIVVCDCHISRLKDVLRSWDEAQKNGF